MNASTTPNTTKSGKPQRPFILPTTLLLACLLLSGCSFLQTIESEQWVTMPIYKDGQIKSLVTPPAYILAKEQELVGIKEAAIMKQIAWNMTGTVHCKGPANITRRFKYAGIEMEIITENSNWIAGINERVTGAFKWMGETVASMGKTVADVML